MNKDPRSKIQPPKHISNWQGSWGKQIFPHRILQVFHNYYSLVLGAWILGLITFLQLPNRLIAQPEIFGYYEGEMDGIEAQGQQYNFGYNKLRLDMLAHPDEQITFKANLNIQRYFGKTTWNLFDFLPERIWKPIYQPDFLPDSLWISEFPFLLPDTLYLDNVYLKVSFRYFDLTIGKQQISLGTGYAWNPLDIFNRKELLDPTYEQTGINALRVEIPLAERLVMDVIISPKDSWKSSAKMIQVKHGLGSFDLTGSYTEYWWENPPMGWRWRTENGDFSNVIRKIVGWSFVGEAFDLGLWGEGFWDVKEAFDEYEEYLIGFDHTFDFQTYMLVEYFHNGSGANTTNLHIFDYIYYFNGQSHSLMKDYAFVFINQPLTDLVTFGLFGIVNLNDKSMVINPQLEWNIFENVNLSLLLSHFEGDDDSEFGLQDWGIRLRLRAYF